MKKKERKLVKDKAKRAKPLATGMISGLEHADVDHVVREYLTDYGLKTIEDRALPDFRDGCKPAHRRILWAMTQMGVRSTGVFVKAAKVSGNVIGTYHPHGDQAAYGTMVTMAQFPERLIHGSGNWGTYDDPAASARYTECRLSKFADEAILQRDYLEVVPKVPNYDGTEVEPLYLPSLVPNVLLNGADGIAVGLTTNIPSFELPGVLALAKLAVSGTEIKAKHCLKHLQFKFRWGGADCISKDEALLEYYRTGEGRLEFKGRTVFDGRTNQLIILGLPPGFNLEKFTEKLMEKDLAYGVNEDNDAETEIRIVITLKKQANLQAYQKVVSEIIRDHLTKPVSYKTNVIRRYIDPNSAELSEARATVKDGEVPNTIPDLLNEWAVYRIELEREVLRYRISKLNEEIPRLKLVRKAIDFIDTIAKLLKKKTANIDAELAKAMKISLEDAAYVLSIQVRRLGHLSKTDLDNQIKALNDKVAFNKKMLKTPEVSVLETLKMFEGYHDKEERAAAKKAGKKGKKNKS